MNYNPKKKCGVKVQDFNAMKVYVNKFAKYVVVLGKVKDKLFGGDPEDDVEYYLADSTGLPICPDNATITVQDEHGTDIYNP